MDGSVLYVIRYGLLRVDIDPGWAYGLIALVPFVLFITDIINGLLK